MVHVSALVVLGRDGKLYPPDLPRPAAERRAICALIHSLHCREGLSIRRTQAALLERYQIRRSRGQVHKYLAWECPYCSTAPRPPQPKDPAQKARVFQWR
jgi:hypothetical protein